jgi:predicted metalloendopeptidase
VLQPPFYSGKNPKFLNLGSIGMIIGHELSHAFDASGRKFNGKGELSDWWTKSSADEFEKRQQCFIDQYVAFSTEINGTTYNINGKLTVNENIADSGGVARAWDAWWKTGEERGVLLKGLEKFSSSQLFFLSMR